LISIDEKYIFSYFSVEDGELSWLRQNAIDLLFHFLS